MKMNQKSSPGSFAATHCPPLNLSVISNSRLLREGLIALLDEHIRLCLIGSYAGTLPTPPNLPNPPEHIVLLDGGVGRDAAFAWTRYWCCRSPPAQVLVMELVNDVDVIIACIEAGAGGYTLQGATGHEVAEAIELLHQGRALCGPEIAAEIFHRLAAHARAAQPATPPVHLSERELQVLTYIAEDYSNQRIAEALVIEVRTVKHHVHNILEKLQLHHREDAARLARNQGWIDSGAPALALPDC